MARRSDHSREELAELVIDAARAITEAEGWRGVTMRGLGSRIDYAPGSIYNAVGNLDTVLMRMNAGTLDRLAETLESAARRSADAPLLQRAAALADGYMKFVMAHARLWASVLERVPQYAVPAWYAAPRARLVEIVAEVIAPLYPNAKARRRAVVVLWAALQGVASLGVGGNLAFAAAELDPRDIARSIVLRYLTGTEPKQ